MKISVITPSFNKPPYVLEAIQSVLNQTFQDFEYHIVDNSTDGVTTKIIGDFIKDQQLDLHKVHFTERYFLEEERKKVYPTTVIINEFLEESYGDFIFYLSDDDYFLPNCFERVMQEFDRHPEAKVIYFGLKVIDNVQNHWQDVSVLKADHKLAKGTNMDCMLDGGQVVFRKECIKQLTQPYFRTEMDNDTAHCDGIFLNRLSALYDFYNIPDILAVKRRTSISTFIKT